MKHEGSIFTKNGGDLENKGTGALLLVEPDGGSLPDALLSRRAWWVEGFSPGALFSARVVVCLDPTVSSRLPDDEVDEKSEGTLVWPDGPDPPCISPRSPLYPFHSRWA